MTKLVRVSDEVHQKLCDIGRKNESFNTIIEKLLSNNEAYLEIQELIKADEALEKGDFNEYESTTELLKHIKNE